MNLFLKWLAVILLALACSLLSDTALRAQSSPLTVQFSSSYPVDPISGNAIVNANESDGTTSLVVTLSEAASDVVTVDFATSDDTAIAGTDYTAASGTVTFQPGVTSQTISIVIIDNGSYTNQSVYFTVALSDPSEDVTLGMPSTAYVYVLDNDPTPVAILKIPGVNPDNQGNSVGFVSVNANNDNGSVITYANDMLNATIPINTSTGKPVSEGIPTMRDFDPKNTNLANADPDLLEIIFSTKNLRAGETLVLTVSQNGRAQVQVWDTGTKNNIIVSPATWIFPKIPPSVFVEGLLEGAALQEVALMLQIVNKGNVVSTSTALLTVTPVLTDLTVIPAGGIVPNVAVFNGVLIIDSGAGQPNPTVTMATTAQMTEVRGGLYFIQNAQLNNNLVIAGQNGTWGADLGPRKWGYAPPNTNNFLADCLKQANVRMSRT